MGTGIGDRRLPPSAGEKRGPVRRLPGFVRVLAAVRLSENVPKQES